MRNWEPSPKDATAIAAFRWFANALENRALELYLTDRTHFEHIESVFRRTLKEIDDTQARSRVAQEEDGCPEGWVLCDGICKPSCDPMEG